MTTEEKLDFVLKELERVKFPDENTHPDKYWNEVQVRCDNATDTICDFDQFIKTLIHVIKS